MELITGGNGGSRDYKAATAAIEHPLILSFFQPCISYCHWLRSFYVTDDFALRQCLLQLVDSAFGDLRLVKAQHLEILK